MKRKILILICLILLIVSIANVSAADDANQTVNDDTLSVSDDIDVISAKDDGTFTALQEKINNAPAGSTITLENDYYYDEGFSRDGILIEKEGLTIDGNGHTLNGMSKSRIFHFYSSSHSNHYAVLKNITFYNGYTESDGGALYPETNYYGSSRYGPQDIPCFWNLKVDNCVFYNNTAGSGGAIRDGKLTITDSSFINNVASYYGGAIGSVELHNNGGAIGSYSTCNGCIFINNHANNGGALLGGDLYYCNFTNNTADRNGGAIYVYETTEVFSCIFNSNNASSGGAIMSFLDDLNIENSIFMNNNASSGGAINFDVRLTFYNDYYSSIKFKNLKFINNTPNVYGGGIMFSNNILSIRGQCSPYEETIYIISGELYVDIAGKSFKNIFDSGKTNFDLSSVPAGTWDTKISYNGDKNFGAFEITLPLTIESSTVLEVPDVTKNYGGSERLQITLTESGTPVANADVNININGVDYTRTTDSNGKASMAINLNSGQYYATVTYKDVSTKALVTVNALNTETTLSYTKNSHNSVTLTALVNPATATGNVVFNVNGKDYNAKIADGKATYQLSGLAIGDYEAKATYNGDMNHKQSSSNSVKFTVEDVKVDVIAPDLTKYYKGPERFVVTVKEDGKTVVGKDVTINLNGATYTRTTNENGEASMAINLNSGEYKVTSEFEGIKVESTITVKQTVSGENITKIFRNGTQYYAAFVDTSGKTLAENTSVEFNINGVFYTRYTNDKGVARMNINLNPGEYIITAKNPNSTEQYTNIITVLPSIVENYNLTKYYRNASQYSLRLLDDEGNPVKAGVEITLNINGVFYKRMSNATGYVNMNINLEPGEYIITADYNGLMASNTIKVLSVIETRNLSMSYKDGSKFEAKILDGQGNPYPNQTVTFNINGVFYEKVTDENGIARLAINLMVGEYIITSSYNGLNAANKVTISS